MDSKKHSKRVKTSGPSEVALNEASTSNDITELPDFCNSLDFPSSQECFSVGWDWSCQNRGSKKPAVRVIERPMPKKSEGLELLECHRPRRLIRKCDPDMYDASVFAEELKSLASDLKSVPESNSPVTSPHFIVKRRRDGPSTPTSTKVLSNPSSDSPILTGNTTISMVQAACSIDSGVIADKKESLNDLLDDSLGPDLLKFTQDLEQDLQQTESKKINLTESSTVPSSKKKTRLSLNSKPNTVPSRNVRRRINDIYEQNQPLRCLNSVNDGKGTPSKYKGKKKGHQNNNNESLKVDFDEFDEATLQTIGEIEEKEMVKSRTLDPVSNQACSSSKHINNAGQSTLEEEDEVFKSISILGMIDELERKATEAAQKKDVKGGKALNLLDMIDVQHAEKFYRSRDQKEAVNVKNQPPSRKKTSSSAGNVLRCTPEEIEKKRQEARKRLQLKKKHK